MGTSTQVRLAPKPALITSRMPPIQGVRRFIFNKGETPPNHLNRFSSLNLRREGGEGLKRGNGRTEPGDIRKPSHLLSGQAFLSAGQGPWGRVLLGKLFYSHGKRGYFLGNCSQPWGQPRGVNRAQPPALTQLCAHTLTHTGAHTLARGALSGSQFGPPESDSADSQKADHRLI